MKVNWKMERSQALEKQYRQLSLRLHPDKLKCNYLKVRDEFSEKFPTLPITHAEPSEQLIKHIHKKFTTLSNANVDWEKMYKDALWKHVEECIKKPETFKKKMNRCMNDAKIFEKMCLPRERNTNEVRLEILEIRVEFMRQAQEKEQLRQEKERVNQKEKELIEREKKVERMISLIKTFDTTGQVIKIYEELLRQDDSKKDNHRKHESSEVQIYHYSCAR